MKRTVYDIGFIGKGKHRSKINGRDTKCYKTWSGVLERCYSKKLHEKHITYRECTVCEEWYDFQNFAEWYHKNYYEVQGERMHLDKDILIKGNKKYSPTTCVFVPQNINKIFTKRDSDRGKLPIGVRYKKVNRNYEVRCNNGKGKSIYLGVYNTPEEAFYKYKEYKERIIKKIADMYKDYIPQHLHDALYSYKVEIND